ncbi:MAG: hypothetical protein E7658_02505 [Ruminococcaceae bacterium]|nr:hypothetical protein [Oscillospiraceae bacterium]
MKKCICALLASLFLTSCSASLVNLKYKDGQLINKRLDLAYNAAPVNYEPVSVGKAYAYYGEIDMTLYEIPGTDKKQWLSQENMGSGTTVFYNENIELPTLYEMQPENIYVCTGEGVTISVVTIDDEALIGELITLFETGRETALPNLDPMDTYELKFHGEEYPHLYYNLSYAEYSRGIFLYDRHSKRCVEIGDILEEWVYNEWEE